MCLFGELQITSILERVGRPSGEGLNVAIVVSDVTADVAVGTRVAEAFHGLLVSLGLLGLLRRLGLLGLLRRRHLGIFGQGRALIAGVGRLVG